MTDLSPRQRIRFALTTWFEMLRDGDILTTDECVKRVNAYIPHRAQADTIKRYMRELRSDGTIKYVFIGPKNKKSIRVVK